MDLTAGNYKIGKSLARRMEGQIRKHLAARRMIAMQVAGDEYEPRRRRLARCYRAIWNGRVRVATIDRRGPLGRERLATLIV